MDERDENYWRVTEHIRRHLWKNIFHIRDNDIHSILKKAEEVQKAKKRYPKGQKQTFDGD